MQMKFQAIAGVINKIRIIQGWNMVSPKDAEPVGAVWIEQLDRFGVAPELYNLLLDKAIDYRVGYLKRGENPPSLTVELILAMFETHKTETRQIIYSKEHRLRTIKFDYIESADQFIGEFVPAANTGVFPYDQTEEKQFALFQTRRAHFISETNRKHNKEFQTVKEIKEHFENQARQLKAQIEEIAAKAYLPVN